MVICRSGAWQLQRERWTLSSQLIASRMCNELYFSYVKCKMYKKLNKSLESKKRHLFFHNRRLSRTVCYVLYCVIKSTVS